MVTGDTYCECEDDSDEPCANCRMETGWSREQANEIEELRSKIEQIRNYATRPLLTLWDVDQILLIAKECEADQDSEVSDE